MLKGWIRKRCTMPFKIIKGDEEIVHCRWIAAVRDREGIFQVVPPDGGWGWVVVIAAFYCIFVMDGIANTYGLFLPIFQQEFDASLFQVSLINSLFTGFYFLFGPVAGALSNRFGFRAVIISGSIVSAFGIGISIFNTSVQLMFLTYGFFGGLGFSLMYINVILTVGFYFERWRALATGITLSASGAGTFSFAPAVQILLRSYTWKHILIGYSGLVFLCSAVAICFRPLMPVKIHIENEESYPFKNLQSSRKFLYDNKIYPTAAELSTLTIIKGSKASIRTHKPNSFESLEIGRENPREYQSSTNRSIRSRAANSDGEELELLTKKKWFSSCCQSCCKYVRKCFRRERRHGLRPLYREDIFYEGSVTHLPAYEKNLRTPNRGSVVVSQTPLGCLSRISNRSLFYNMSVSRMPTRADIKEEQNQKCHLCPERVLRVLKIMFDCGVLKIPVFILFLISASLMALAASVPVQFSYVRAVELKIMSKDEASLMLSTFGITNTLGRILCGLICSIRQINIMLFHTIFLLLGAILNGAIIHFFNKIALYVYAVLYGFIMAEQGSLRSVILIQLVGLENLTNAFGILLLFLGVFTIIGSPMAGFLKEQAGSYDSVFYFSSVSFALSAFFSLPILLWKRSFLRGSPPTE